MLWKQEGGKYKDEAGFPKEFKTNFKANRFSFPEQCPPPDEEISRIPKGTIGKAVFMFSGRGHY